MADEDIPATSNSSSSSSIIAAVEEIVGSSTSSEGGSPASQETEESLPSIAEGDDGPEDPYQKITATLREQIKSTDEELVGPCN